jgi:hypothetical protein
MQVARGKKTETQRIVTMDGGLILMKPRVYFAVLARRRGILAPASFDQNSAAKISPRRLWTRDHPHTLDLNPMIRSTLSISSHTGRTMWDQRRGLIRAKGYAGPNHSRSLRIQRSGRILPPRRITPAEENPARRRPWPEIQSAHSNVHFLIRLSYKLWMVHWAQGWVYYQGLCSVEHPRWEVAAARWNSPAGEKFHVNSWRTASSSFTESPATQRPRHTLLTPSLSPLVLRPARRGGFPDPLAVCGGQRIRVKVGRRRRTRPGSLYPDRGADPNLLLRSKRRLQQRRARFIRGRKLWHVGSAVQRQRTPLTRGCDRPSRPACQCPSRTHARSTGWRPDPPGGVAAMIWATRARGSWLGGWPRMAVGRVRAVKKGWAARGKPPGGPNSHQWAHYPFFLFFLFSL